MQSLNRPNSPTSATPATPGYPKGSVAAAPKTDIVDRDKLTEDIIKAKTAAAPEKAATDTSQQPIVNVTVDTTAIAEMIAEHNKATAALIESSIAAQNERIDKIAASPHHVNDPGDLDDEKAPKPPNIYIARNTRGMDAKAAKREFDEILERSQKASFDGGRGVGQLTAMDTRMVDQFIMQNRAAMQQAMQDEGYKHGLFRAAATQITDIPASFSGYLSSIMRMTPKWGKVWHQFLNPVIRLGSGVGNQVDVPRMGKINRPIVSTNWQLSGTGFSPNSQALTNGYEKVIIDRYGMGEPGQNNDPVGVDEYYFRHSILDLEAQIQEVLGENLNEFREIITYEQYAGTPLTRYFKSTTKSIETAATAMTAADSGIIEYEALVRLRATMNGDLGVIPWPDGCYALVAHPNAIVDLELELTKLSKPISRNNIEEVTNMIKMVNTSMQDQLSGYRFTVGGFHIFSHENVPPDPNFMKSTTGAGATLRNWYDNIAFGPMAVCECISMAPEVRRDEVRQFGTLDRYIWIMYGKYQSIERGTASTGAGLGQRSQVVKFRSGRQ